MKITEPGIYRDVASAEYFEDPCPLPSLTQSACKTLLDRSPWHAWTGSAALNPDWLPDDDTKFDLGNVAHKLTLGRGKEFEVLDFDSWRTKAANEARKDALERGKVPILEDGYTQAVRMAAAGQRQINMHEDHDAFTNGTAEVMIAWQEDGIWFRSLVDWLHADLRTVDDFKSTKKSVAPHVIGFVAQSAGWEIQAAFIERGLDILDPAGAGRRRFRFIAQETDEPFALNVMHMDESWLTMGRKKVQTAVTLWERCVHVGKWPGYPSRGVVPEYPSYKQAEWLNREESGEFESDPTLIMAG